MLALFPEGFEERERGGLLELAAYTNAEGLARLEELFGPAATQPVEAGWEERWRDFHRPVRVGQLWLGPPWESPPSDAVAVVIDPGRAFGTGAHPTTRLAIEALFGLEPGSVLDAGCGSGAVAIAAGKLGFRPLVAVDIDPAAVEAALRNARRNHVSLDVRLGDVLTIDLPRVDVVVANIAAGVITPLAGRIGSALLVTSGYLDGDPLPLPGFRRRDRLTLDGWAADVFERAG